MKIKLPLNLTLAQEFEIRRWLVANVGDYERRVMGYYVGHGWKMGRRLDVGGMAWIFDIDDERMATLFLLRWS